MAKATQQQNQQLAQQSADIGTREFSGQSLRSLIVINYNQQTLKALLPLQQK